MSPDRQPQTADTADQDEQRFHDRKSTRRIFVGADDEGQFTILNRLVRRVEVGKHHRLVLGERDLILLIPRERLGRFHETPPARCTSWATILSLLRSGTL